MNFTLSDIDHIHIQVQDREAAAAWYARVLGLYVIEALAFWAEDGPLTIGNDQIHLALFTGARANLNTVALRVDIDEFEQVKKHLDTCEVEYQYEDHDLSISVYLTDPDGNRFEITAYR